LIWTKTAAGRAEMQTRALVKERVQRTLLLLIDGSKSDEQLLASVDGTHGDDFKRLEALGLIAAVALAPRATPTARDPAAAAAPVAAPTDYAQFTATLTQMISSELGLRGFPLTLAVEKAGTIEELQAVAQRTIEQIGSRKGEPAAAAARRALYGG
jgi:hypothetical protein